MRKKNVLVIAVLTAVFAGVSCKGKITAPGEGQVVFVQGEVSINGQAVSVHDKVTSGSTITTGEKSKIDLHFNGANIIRIGENASASVDFSNASATLQSGSLAAVMKNLEKQKGFTLNTPTTSAGVRGTSFFAKVEEGNRTYFCDCNGVIEVQGKNGEGKQVVESAHHKAFLFSGEDGEVSVEEADLLYHSDEDLEEIAAKIDENIDWEKIPGKE